MCQLRTLIKHIFNNGGALIAESGQIADTRRPPVAKIVDSVDDLTAAWLTDALRQAGGLNGGRVASFTSELMSVGQLGLVAPLTLSYDMRDRTSRRPSWSSCRPKMPAVVQ